MCRYDFLNTGCKKDGFRIQTEANCGKQNIGVGSNYVVVCGLQISYMVRVATVKNA